MLDLRQEIEHLKVLDCELRARQRELAMKSHVSPWENHQGSKLQYRRQSLSNRREKLEKLVESGQVDANAEYRLLKTEYEWILPVLSEAELDDGSWEWDGRSYSRFRLAAKDGRIEALRLENCDDGWSLNLVADRHQIVLTWARRLKAVLVSAE